MADFEHERVLEGLVVTFRDREDLDVLRSAGVGLRRADEVADVLKEQEVEIFRRELFEGLAGHLGIHGAFAAGVDLDGTDAGIGHGLGIDGGVDVGLHDADLILILQRGDGREERRGLARTGRGHDVQHEGLLRFQFRAVRVGDAVVFIEDADIDVDDTEFSHSVLLLYACCSLTRARIQSQNASTPSPVLAEMG